MSWPKFPRLVLPRVGGWVVEGEEEVLPAAPEPRLARWLRGVIRWSLLALAFLVPLAYLPVTPDQLFIKVLLVEAGAVLVAVAWLLLAIVTRQVRYTRSPVNPALLALAVVLLAGTLASVAPWSSFWGPDATGEKTATLLALAAIAFVAAAVLERRDVRRTSLLLLSSFLILGLFTLVSMLLARFGTVPAWLAVNPVGTVNALAYVLGAGFVLASMLALARRSGGDGSLNPTRFDLGIALAIPSAVILFVDLILIGFRIGWIALGVMFVVMIALQSTKFWSRPDDGAWAAEAEALAATGAGVLRPGWGMGGMMVASLIVAVAVFVAVRGAPLAGRIFQPPIEVSPALGATLGIGGKVISRDPLLGLGPSQFETAYNRFRDPAINNSIFWNTRFAHGFSFLATMLATTGLLGVLALVGLVVTIIGALVRAFLSRPARDPYLLSLGGGAVFVVVMWFLYPSNLTASFLAFLFLGLVTALVRDYQPSKSNQSDRTYPSYGSDGKRSWWRVTRRTIPVAAPAANFVVSLVAVFGAALGLMALYGLGTQYASEIWFRRAAVVLNRFGNVESAGVFLERAIQLDPTRESAYQGRVQVSWLAVNRLVAEVAQNPSSPELAARLRAEFGAGEAAGRRATALAPANPLNWFILGQLYETVLPYVPGGDRASLDAFGRAEEQDPVNPAFTLARGRVHITVADILQLQAARVAPGQEQKRFFEGRAEALAKARQALERAIELKVDYAAAHFLLAQLAIRENNLAEAIAKTEDTARLAPGDIGVAFQLGVLYYNAGRLDPAKAELERALLLNENYSNARYFLGLVWDQKGDKDAALSQFQKIAALNPDNEEIRRIMANLSAGRPALAEIVPPAPAPEKRKEPPVIEGGEEAKPLQKAGPRR